MKSSDRLLEAALSLAVSCPRKRTSRSGVGSHLKAWMRALARMTKQTEGAIDSWAHQAGVYAFFVSLVLALVPHHAAAFPWSIDMFRGQAVQPLALPPRNMPAGTLPTHGASSPLSRARAAEIERNPLVPTATHLAAGKALFEIHCTPCHGGDAKGNGPVADQMVVRPPDLTTGPPTQRSDGYLAATIRNGGEVMPAYADAMSSAERWSVVLYLRHLQATEAAR